MSEFSWDRDKPKSRSNQSSSSSSSSSSSGSNSAHPIPDFESSSQNAGRISRSTNLTELYGQDLADQLSNLGRSTLTSAVPEPRTCLNVIGRRLDPPTVVFGVDIARYGSDHSVLWARHPADRMIGPDRQDGALSSGHLMDPEFGPFYTSWMLGYSRWVGLDTHQSAHIIANTINSWENAGWIVLWACIDSLGVGAGTVDNLWHMNTRMQTLIKAVNPALKSFAKFPRFQNVRSELAWNLRNFFRSRQVRFLTDVLAKQVGLKPVDLGSNLKVGIPVFACEKLEQQATSIRARIDDRNVNGILIEPKEIYKERMEGVSPDEFDGAVYCHNDKLIGIERRPRNAQQGSVIER